MLDRREGIEMRFRVASISEERSIKMTKIQSTTAWFFLIIYSLLV